MGSPILFGLKISRLSVLRREEDHTVGRSFKARFGWRGLACGSLRLAQRIGFLAPVHIFPGEDELEALAMNALGVLRGELGVQVYR